MRWWPAVGGGGWVMAVEQSGATVRLWIRFPIWGWGLRRFAVVGCGRDEVRLGVGGCLRRFAVGMK